MEEFRFARNKVLIIIEMSIYGAFLLWFIYQMVPLGLK
jgi:hypothetical protein